MGGLRSSAQMISYELAMGASVIGVVMLAGTLDLNGIIYAQINSPFRWFIIPQFIGFIVFLIAAFAETNRVPFDLPEAETELVAGFHTEYSALKFALFFMAEYVNMFTVSVMCTVLFLGGWYVPGLGADSVRAGLDSLCADKPRRVLSARSVRSCSFISGSAERCRDSGLTS